MRKLLCLIFCIPFISLAQVSDDFNDGDFTVAPAWVGDASQFLVNPSFQLQLNSVISDTSYLSTPSTTSNNCEWHLYVKLSFAPSDNNNMRIYLLADIANLETATLNGYYIRMGENGSFDSVDLWKQVGNTHTKIIDGINGHCAKATNTLGIKIIRDAIGNWTLLSDTLGGVNYQTEGVVMDNTIMNTSYFGVWCKYTISNANKFFFDNIYSGPVIVDNIAPTILSANISSATQLDVTFDEPLEITSAQTAANYSTNNGLGNPALATLDNDPTLVHLSFATPFVSGTTYTLTVNGLKDLTSNTINNGVVPFLYYVPINFNVVINEIMADPDPAIGLPNYEYVELFNNSAFPIQLNNWTISTTTTTKTIPNCTLLPDSFMVLSGTGGAAAYGNNISVIGITSFPAFTNTGTSITLKDQNGQVISAVSYSDSWYQDNNKTEGGWSLEQIDPHNPCAGIENWKASANASGGTPGRKNAIFGSNPDSKAPELVRVSVIDNTTIQAYFSESVDSASTLSLASYSVDNGIGNPIAVNGVEPFYNSIALSLGTALVQDVVYTLAINGSVVDCIGNVVSTNNTARFAIPKPVAVNDIVINEILPDPNDGGVDFVEIYNRSNKVIDLDELRLSSQDTITGTLESIYTIAPEGYLLFPEEYIVLASDSKKILTQYNTTNKKGFIDMPSIPSMNIDGDVVVLSNLQDVMIDKLVYYNSWHFPLLNNTKGISLERIDFNRPTQDATNWHSAAENIGFATPAYKNSQYSNGSSSGTEITISPEIFSPDNDGYNDVLNINYVFDEPGYVGSVSIFDEKGRLIRGLVKNQLLAVSGTISWDGTTNDKEKGRIGIFIIFFETFDLKGNMKHYKKTCVVGGKI